MRLAILDYGLFEIYQNGRQIGIQGYLIQTADRNILVDTGFHADYTADPFGVALSDGLGKFGRLLDYRADQNPHDQLALLGLTNIDITDLVITHGHVDHVGRIAEFPNARLWVSQRERSLPTPSYWDGRSRVQWPAIPTEAVPHGCEIAPGVVILAADAISRPDEFADDTWSDAEDPGAARASAYMLRHLSAERNAWLIYGHCPQQWPVLRKAPFWYD